MTPLLKTRLQWFRLGRGVKIDEAPADTVNGESVYYEYQTEPLVMFSGAKV